WYLISVERLKQIGLIILLLILGLAGWWYFSNQKRNPRSAAEAAIAEARQALNTLAASKDFSSHRGDFDRAQHKLDEAGTKLGGGKYAEAESAAIESQTFSRAALSGKAGVENDAQFLTVEGDVQFQKSATSDWAPAETRARAPTSSQKKDRPQSRRQRAGRRSNSPSTTRSPPRRKVRSRRSRSCSWRPRSSVRRRTRCSSSAAIRASTSHGNRCRRRPR